MRPFFEKEGIAIYNGDCRRLLSEISSSALVVADPPYGVRERTRRRSAGRSSIAPAYDFAPIIGDDEQFDPRPLLRFDRVVLFGANHFADRLPTSTSWIVWDKLDGLTSERRLGFNDNSDCELIWTNLGGPARLIRHRWMGMMKASERRDRRVHPTQKPVAVMRAIIETFSEPGDLILDPYMGSGPVLLAARDAGRRVIGIEINERYCEIAVRRLATSSAKLPAGSRCSRCVGDDGGRGGRPDDVGPDAGGDTGPDAGRGAGTARIADHKRPCGGRDFLKSPPQSKASL